MTITLPAELDHFVESEVAAGRYSSAMDVVCDALVRLRRERDTAELRRSLEEAEASIQRGEGTVLRTEADIDAFFENVEARGRAKLQERRRPS